MNQYTAQQAYELGLLILCVWREARGAGQAAQLGVAWSIRNRVKSGITWWGSTWDSVILAREQYSSFNPNDPNAVKIPKETDPQFANCLVAAEAAYNGTGTDPTNGSTSYYDSSIPAPDWAATMTFVIQIDTLKFYELENTAT
jgi:spore germination cell wall hydrolase CwlJ-like protein